MAASSIRRDMNFSVGDQVWAKMASYPYWPGKVSKDPKQKHKKGSSYIFFYGTDNSAWITNDKIVLHTSEMFQKLPKKISKDMQKAIDRMKTVTRKRKISDDYTIEERIDVLTEFNLLESVERPESPGINWTLEHNNLEEKNIQPSTKKFGFMGLGPMGKAMVKNLLLTGHDVTVWSRNCDKTTEFVEHGAKAAFTPFDLMISCDIVFSCLTDENAVTAIFYERWGVEKGLKSPERVDYDIKGYVELSGIDAKTCKKISSAVHCLNALYVAVGVLGTRSDAQKAKLTAIVAGDHILVEAINSALNAIASDVGDLEASDPVEAIITKSINSSYQGFQVAALSDVLSATEVTETGNEGFLKFAKASGLLSDDLYNICLKMAQRNYSVELPIRHQCRDMASALYSASENNMPLGMYNRACFLFKKLICHRYGDHDIAALKEANKFNK